MLAIVDEKKQQFNIYLSADLIRRIKHASVDAGQSLSAFVEEALSEHLQRQEADRKEAHR